METMRWIEWDECNWNGQCVAVGELVATSSELLQRGKIGSSSCRWDRSVVRWALCCVFEMTIQWHAPVSAIWWIDMWLILYREMWSTMCRGVRNYNDEGGLCWVVRVLSSLLRNHKNLEGVRLLVRLWSERGLGRRTEVSMVDGGLKTEAWDKRRRC